MELLFLGDIVGRLGRRCVQKVLPDLKKAGNINLVLANAENIASGRGASAGTVNEVIGYGVDYLTGGNHLFRYAEFANEINNLPVLRPANYMPSAPGRGCVIYDQGQLGRFLLINLEGRVAMKGNKDCPFRTADRILEEMGREKLAGIIVDIHAEVTSEKVALGQYLDGRVSAVIGTHTHVPTADAQILPGGTAYVTDVGMVGAKKSVLGVKSEIIFRSYLESTPQKFEWVKEGPAVFQSVRVVIDESTGLATAIKRVDRGVEE